MRCLVIVATNRGEAGLKHDVNYRFQTVIATPSLAERREDIALLVPHLLREIAPALLKSDANGRPYAPVYSSLMVGLLRHELDGNVRGMWRILEKSVEQIGADGLLRWPMGVPVPDAAPLVLRKEERHHAVADLIMGSSGRKPTQPPPPDPSPAPASDPRETFGQSPIRAASCCSRPSAHQLEQDGDRPDRTGSSRARLLPDAEVRDRAPK